MTWIDCMAVYSSAAAEDWCSLVCRYGSTTWSCANREPGGGEVVGEIWRRRSPERRRWLDATSHGLQWRLPRNCQVAHDFLTLSFPTQHVFNCYMEILYIFFEISFKYPSKSNRRSPYHNHLTKTKFIWIWHCWFGSEHWKMTQQS